MTNTAISLPRSFSRRAANSDRVLPAEELAALVDADKLAGVYPSVSEALAALDAAGEPFVAAGTITLAGEVAGLLR